MRVHFRQPKLPFLALALFLACGGTEEPTPAPEPIANLDEAQGATWARLWEEQQATALLVELSERWRSTGRALLVEGATVVPMTGRGPLAEHSVVVEGGEFRAVTPSAEAQAPDDADRVDAHGLFLIPGLVESHSHTISSPSQLLVYLTRGVTTLREMDGFPWMLEARAQASRGELLAPSLIVAGHILSNRPWDFYMTGVDSEEQAHAFVQEQVAAGYDFIKIHNSMPEPLFGAIFEAARKAGVDVAGHIPNEIPITDAIAAGFRTNEHFKGYIFDQTLQITEQDYIAATRGAEMWHTPTFTTYHSHLRGPESRALVEEEGSLPLVPRWMRAMWQRESEAEIDRVTELRQGIYPMSRKLFADIRPLTNRFLAGTDTGTYAYMVPGFALQEEVRIFEELGMTPAEALATATVNPSRAFRQQGRFGTVEVGKRADFVLLEANPLDATTSLSEIVGVSLRGLFLDRQRLDEIERRLSKIFSEETQIPRPTRAAFEGFVAQSNKLSSAGWPTPGYVIDEVVEFMRSAGFEDLADQLSG